ncbi:FAD binding domain-containing protein, partial [uncultured Pseudomonas sp.]|uniref:FAD binding domain-containing protein n=1 Tax=uncultured Pseudomonas sp. TaxID=114707 RepID=UPI00338E6127
MELGERNLAFGGGPLHMHHGLQGSQCHAHVRRMSRHASLAGVATHPSDMCVALAALKAVVHVQGPAAKRQIPFAEFHR